jgi:hypothetical protein
MTVHEILEKEGISEDAVLREHALFVALSKKTFFEAEIRRFEIKYGASFSVVGNKTQSVIGVENFNESDDFMDWEYAVRALDWWNVRAEEARICA